MGSGVGKISIRAPCKPPLTSLYERILDPYQESSDKEAGARVALEVYYLHQEELEEVKGLIFKITDLATSLLEGLRELERARAEKDKRSRTIKTGGCMVVKLVPCGKSCGGCPHGPYAYRVHKEGGRQVWKYLGRAGRGGMSGGRS